MVRTLPVLIALWSFVLIAGVGVILYQGLPDATNTVLRTNCRELLRNKVYLALPVKDADGQIYVDWSAISDIGIDMDESAWMTRLLSENVCPGALHNNTSSQGLTFVVAPQLGMDSLVELERDAIIVCDKPGNHRAGRSEIVNFLLADGSVVTRDVSPSAYLQWVTDRFLQTKTPIRFPPDDLSFLD